ncbi:hypothetical protein K438DRAFT_1755697 [Mycena galopus ATCC 62051]|nr:hypothetical protein K438DRAFT_1755697 [Mycena galopus ATCC 62051]
MTILQIAYLEGVRIDEASPGALRPIRNEEALVGQRDVHNSLVRWNSWDVQQMRVRRRGEEPGKWRSAGSTWQILDLGNDDISHFAPAFVMLSPRGGCAPPTNGIATRLELESNPLCNAKRHQAHWTPRNTIAAAGSGTANPLTAQSLTSRGSHTRLSDPGIRIILSWFSRSSTNPQRWKVCRDTHKTNTATFGLNAASPSSRRGSVRSTDFDLHTLIFLVVPAACGGRTTSYLRTSSAMASKKPRRIAAKHDNSYHHIVQLTDRTPTVVDTILKQLTDHERVKLLEWIGEAPSRKSAQASYDELSVLDEILPLAARRPRPVYAVGREMNVS